MQTPYSRSRRLLHWFSAVMILWATFSGFGVLALAPGAPLRHWVEAANPQVTSVFIPFFAWRLWLRLRSPAPSGHGAAAEWVHWALYGLIAAVLATGVLMMDHAVVMFGLFSLPQLVHGGAALAALHHWHHLACMALAALVALHLAAVVWHQVRGDNIMERMC